MRRQAAFPTAQTRQQPNRRSPVSYCIHVEEVTGPGTSPDPIEPSVGPGPVRLPPMQIESGRAFSKRSAIQNTTAHGPLDEPEDRHKTCIKSNRGRSVQLASCS